MYDQLILEEIGKLFTSSFKNYKSDLIIGLLIVGFVYVAGVVINVLYQKHLIGKIEVGTATKITLQNLQINNIQEIYNDLVNIQNKLLEKGLHPMILSEDIPNIRAKTKKYSINIDDKIIKLINSLIDLFNDSAASSDSRNIENEDVFLKKIKKGYKEL